VQNEFVKDIPGSAREILMHRIDWGMRLCVKNFRECGYQWRWPESSDSLRSHG